MIILQIVGLIIGIYILISIAGGLIIWFKERNHIDHKFGNGFSKLCIDCVLFLIFPHHAWPDVFGWK